MTDMGPLRCSRFLKIFFMFMLTITPILASGRDIILFLEDEEVKEGAQGELGAEDDNSLDSGVLKEDSDEWDEFGDMEDISVDEIDTGSWRKILEETLSRENISSTEEGLYISGVNKMMFAVSEGEPELMKEAISDLHHAEDGYAHAQSTLGFLYEIGSGVEKSDAKAFLYHHFAAEGGNF
jgi:SEL1 protein